MLIDRWLRWGTGVSVLLAVFVALWAHTVESSRAGYRVGDRLDIDIGQAVGRTSEGPRLLAVWFDSGCAACAEMSVFLKRLQQTAVPIVYLTAEPRERLAAFLDDQGLVGPVMSVDRTRVKFKGTPTMLLVGAGRVVEGVWYGRPEDKEAEDDVAMRVSRSASR